MYTNALFFHVYIIQTFVFLKKKHLLIAVKIHESNDPFSPQIF